MSQAVNELGQFHIYGISVERPKIRFWFTEILRAMESEFLLVTP